MDSTTTNPIRVSYSQLQKWDRCRFAWWLSYEGKWTPKQKHDGLAIGSLVHEFLEHHYEGVKDGYRGNPVDRHVSYAQERASTVDPELLTHYSTAVNLVRRYIAEYGPYEDSGYEVVGLEDHVVVELTTPKGRPYEYELYYDLLLRHESSGKIWLVDHKTHKSRPFTDAEVMMHPQLPSYAMALREKGLDVFGIMINMLNTYPYKNPKSATTDKLFTRIKSYRTPEELNAIIREIGYTVDDIIDNSNQPRRSLSRDCSWCEFRDPCLMNMKGASMLPILESSFEKKAPRPVEDDEEEIEYRSL